MTYVCPMGHEVGERRERIRVRCETEGCTARIAYEPVAHGRALAGELEYARRALGRAIGCTGEDGCLGPLSLPKCEPCVAFAHEHMYTTAADPL